MPGRVTRVDMGQCTVVTEDGPRRVDTPRRVYPAVGDWLALTDEPPHVHILPRRSTFTRASAGEETRQQVVAANVDTVFIFNALDGRLSLRRIERYLTLGWQSGAVPVVLLTKADLVDAAELEGITAQVQSVAIGVDVHLISAGDDAGLRALDPYLAPGRTVALLGSSGAGKSTLVNRLAGEEMAVTGDVRSDGKGRHTTTHRELLVLPSGALIVDTPGMRGIGMWDAEEGIEQTFSDVIELMQECRFSDCAHDTEPGCAVRLAIAEGRLEEARFDSLRKLQQELENLAARQDARLRAEQVRRFKTITKNYRKHPPRPPDGRRSR